MDSKTLMAHANHYLNTLSVTIHTRQVGSRGNQQAADYVARFLSDFGFQVETPTFDCFDWDDGAVTLTVNDQPYQAFASPYSLGCQVQAPLAVASTLAELSAVDADGKVLLLYGELAKEQLMPKNFKFYNPPEHQEIYRLLESKTPAAILTATGRNPELAGAVYPFPMIEDGDFNIPSAYLTNDVGLRIAEMTGDMVSLSSPAQRIPSIGWNVIGRKGGPPPVNGNGYTNGNGNGHVNGSIRDASMDYAGVVQKPGPRRNGYIPRNRLVFTAHIDSKLGTSGALDNAVGVVSLMLLAELLKDYTGPIEVELVAINGEDYYSNPGETLYLNSNSGRMDEIMLAVNVDGVAFHQGGCVWSAYDLPPEIASTVSQAFNSQPGITQGESWCQGDHMLFVMNQRPAIAVTSEDARQIVSEIAHTDKDRSDLIDPTHLVHLASAFQELVTLVNENQHLPIA
jgi:aminopeptidase YwaD